MEVRKVVLLWMITWLSRHKMSRQSESEPFNDFRLKALISDCQCCYCYVML